MRYEINGIEIQYRECQILRDAGEKLLKISKYGSLKNNVNAWISEIRKIGIRQVQKKKYCIPLVEALQTMEEQKLDALIEYIKYLIEKEEGIEIMAPYITHNEVLILIVNTHEYMK